MGSCFLHIIALHKKFSPASNGTLTGEDRNLKNQSSFTGSIPLNKENFTSSTLFR